MYFVRADCLAWISLAGERGRERYIIALVHFAAKTSSSRHAYIHWQTSHSNMFSFMRHTHKPHTHADTVTGISSVTVIAVSQRKYVDRLIQVAISRVFHGIHSFPVVPLLCVMLSVTLSYTVLDLFSVWRTGGSRQF